MAEALEKENAAAPASATSAHRAAGAAGAARGGGAEQLSSRTNLPTVLTAEDFRQIGRVLNGEHWQADVASQIACSKSQITRYLNGTRDLTPLTGKHLQYVLVERVTALLGAMGTLGMPYHGSQALVDATKIIEEALATLPGQEPPRAR